MRIVLDTNVFVSALLSGGGASRQVVRRCLDGHDIPLVGITLLSEYRDLMSRAGLWVHCKLTPEERQEVLRGLLSKCVPVETYFRWRPNLPDEGDNHIIELAVAGNASAIITHNVRDFRYGELAFPSIEILDPAGFIRRQR